MRVLLVRHGETDYNLRRRYQGRTDTPLNKAGLQQAERLQQRLQHEKVDKIYTSNLKRTVDTAGIISDGRDIAKVISENLSELSFGRFEGMTHDEIIREYPDWKATNFDFTDYGGENLEHLILRMRAFYEELRNSNPADSDILVVSHYGCLSILICIILGIDSNKWQQIYLDLASLSIIDYLEQQPVLTLLNDTCHLKNRERQ